MARTLRLTRTGIAMALIALVVLFFVDGTAHTVVLAILLPAGVLVALPCCLARALPLGCPPGR